MPPFRPGLDLARGLYREVVRELVEVPHAAALIGEGSEVLGYDQPRSTDHSWGPRLLVFVADEHVPAACREAIQDGPLREVLPVGGIDQLTHADDALINFTGWPRRLAQAYQAMLDGAG